jgi:PAS domain S-box-containing protein/diguanylate cyclase (GGDEF)-like protein
VLGVYAEQTEALLAWLAPDGRIGWATEAMRRFIGFADVSGVTLARLIHPDDRSAYEQALRTAVGQNLRIKGSGGTFRQVRLLLRGLPTAASSGTAVILTPMDALGTHIPTPDWAHQASDVAYEVDARGIVMWVLPSVTQWLGWTPEDMIGRNILDFVCQTDREQAAQLGEVLRHRGSLGFGADDRPALQMCTAEGGSRWLSGSVTPRLDEAGAVVSAVVTLRDVTDLMEARLQAEAHVQQWRATVDSMLDPVLVLVPHRDTAGEIVDFTFTVANAAAAVDQGMPIDELVGRRFLELFPHLQEAGLFEAYSKVVETGEPLILDDVEVFNDVLSESRRYDIRAARGHDCVVLTWRDITQRHETQKQLAAQEAVYRVATESAYDAVVQVDDQGVVRWASPSFERIAGYRTQDLVGSSADILIAPEDAADIRAAFDEALSGRSSGSAEVRIVTADGSRKWVQVRSRAVTAESFGEVTLMTVLRDIDEEVVARKALEQSSRRDPLTGLATWPAVREQLLNAGSGLNAVLCIGVDRLRAINEAVSYAGGDAVLVEVAQRISAVIAPQGVVGRVAGNEFVVGVPHAGDRALLGIVAEQIGTAVSQPVAVAGQEVVPAVSIGIAVADDVPDELLRRASLAARAARTEGGGRWRFDDPATAAEAERRLWVESQLRLGLAQGEIQAWFQPVVRLRDRRIVGYEALARWPRGSGQVLPPSEFLDVAETSGLVIDVDLAILQQALDVLRAHPDVSVSANVSARTLVSGEYAQRVLTMIEQAGIDPGRLRLEVTETALQFDHQSAVRATTALATHGVKWWLDDFGTGYSTLTHLRDYPISGIKLDRSFTVGVGEEDWAATRLARALVGMAKGLGLETVAEGVEEDAQLRMLSEQGWQSGQGWLFGKPEPL